MVPPLIRHAGEGRHPGDGGGWIPAFAGMTEALCQFVAQIELAHLFSKEAGGTRRVWIIIIPDFVIFVSFVVKHPFQLWVQLRRTTRSAEIASGRFALRWRGGRRRQSRRNVPNDPLPAASACRK